MTPRGLAALALPLALLVAGCVTPASIQSDALDAPLPGAIPVTLHDAVSGAPVVGDVATLAASILGRVTDVGHIAIEPTISATADGVLFYAAAQFEDAPTPVFPFTDILRSTNGGLTWEIVSPRLPTGHNNPPFTGDPYVHVDVDTGRVFSFDMYHLVCSWMSFSDDLGASWTTNPVACTAPQGIHDHQTMTTGKPRALTPVGYPNNVYYCVNRVTDAACAVSLDGGLTFGPLRPLVYVGYDPTRAEIDPSGPPGTTSALLRGLCGGLHGHLVASPDGVLALPKSRCGEPWVAISEDDGLTWRNVLVNAELGAASEPDPSVAFDDAGNFYYLWTDAAGYVRLAVSQDNGATWGPALNVTAPGVTATGLPSLAAGKEGHVAFVYVGTTLPGGYADNPETADWENATWNGYMGVILDALAEAPVVITTMANPPEDPLVRGICGQDRCPGMYDFIDVIIDTQGRPWAAFVDACVEACAQPDGTVEDVLYSNAPGIVMTLASGPALRGEGMLAALPTE